MRLGRRVLAEAAIPAPGREASLLLGHVLGLGEAQVRARGDRPAAPEEASRFLRLLERRADHEPAAYLFGRWEFWGRDFRVDRRVLVPRPETEHLVEAALALPLPTGARIVDVGTGSGCIAVTLACERPTCRVLATDLDVGALEVTRGNARDHGVAGRIDLLRADLTSAVEPGSVDLLVSNPPYVARDDPQVDAGVRRFEPHLALFADGDGRSLLSRLLTAVAAMRGGALGIFEIGWDQGDWIRTEVARREGLELLDLVHDYSGHPRTAVIRRC